MQRVTVLAGFLLLVWGIAGCSKTESELAPETKQSSPASGLTAAQEQLAGVKVGSMQRRLLAPVVACTGEIEVPPQGMASVTAPLGGYISRIDMVPGAYVKKGQLLATLTNPQYIVLQQSFLETAGELKFATQEFERQKRLDASNATAGKRLQESESAFNVLKARLAGLKARLALIGIDLNSLEKGNIQDLVGLRAPISGYVTAVNHHPGAYVEPREAIFEIVNMNELHLHLNVFEQDITRVQPGQAVRFTPTSGGDSSTPYRGTVSLVSPKRDMEARSFDVHGHIDNEDGNLKPGMFVEAEILIEADSFPAVPQGALVFQENIPYVIVSNDSGYRLQRVETGVKMDGWIEIRNAAGLENEKVVVEGASRIAAALRRK